MIYKISLSDVGIDAIKRQLCAGSIVDMHWHDYIELEIILTGRAEHIYNSEAYELSTGHAYIVTHHDLHAFRAVTDITLLNIGFDINLLDLELAKVLQYSSGKKLCCCFDNEKTQALKECFDLIINEISNRNDFSEAMIKSLISRIVIEVIRNSQSNEEQTFSPVRKAIEYIHLNFKNELSLQIISDELGVTPNYLGRIFLHDTGVFFNTYLNQVRLRYVCSLLLFSNISVKEIAIMSGYSSVEYFFYVFKKHIGTTPSEYRKRNSKILTESSISTNSILM